MGARKPFHIIINSNAGTVQNLGREGLESLISQSGIGVESLHFLEPDKIYPKAEYYKNSDIPVLIGGGDGTIRSCAPLFMGSGRALGLLPLGTMNLLAGDLGIPVDTAEALKGYAGGTEEVAIDVGLVNDEAFLCCVGYGTMPETSEFREENRAQSVPILVPRLTVFILNQLDPVHQRRIHLSVNGKPYRTRTSALVVSNNEYSPQTEWRADHFKRPSLQDGKLGVYSAAPRSLWDRVRLLMRLQTGSWRKDPVIREWKGETVVLQTGNTEELISLDGETMTVKTPLYFSVKPRALAFLVPLASEGKGHENHSPL